MASAGCAACRSHSASATSLGSGEREGGREGRLRGGLCDDALPVKQGELVAAAGAGARSALASSTAAVAASVAGASGATSSASTSAAAGSATASAGGASAGAGGSTSAKAGAQPMTPSPARAGRDSCSGVHWMMVSGRLKACKRAEKGEGGWWAASGGSSGAHTPVPNRPNLLDGGRRCGLGDLHATILRLGHGGDSEAGARQKAGEGGVSRLDGGHRSCRPDGWSRMSVHKNTSRNA